MLLCVGRLQSYSDFVDTHERLLEQFAALRTSEQSQAMLVAKGDVLLLEHASSYLLLSCLEDEM